MLSTSIVGGYAMAWHGLPRYTGDIGLLVNPVAGNAARVVASLEACGLGSLGLSEKDFTHPDRIVQLGMAPWRIDLITCIDGLTWDQAISGAEMTTWDPPSPVIGRRALIANTWASDRAQDRADVARLTAGES